MSGSIKSKENFWLLSFWRLMSRVNNVQENIISGEIKPRRIKSQGNSCPGGKFWRKTYREEKVWGKDGAKPLLSVKHIHSSKIEWKICNTLQNIFFVQ